MLDRSGGDLMQAKSLRVWVHHSVTGSVALMLVAGALAFGTAAGASGRSLPKTGFAEPYAGAPWFESLAPTEATTSSQLNQPLGPIAAAVIAKGLGLRRSDAFTQQQYREFVTGRGHRPDPSAAKLVDQSVAILTNTTGRPLISNIDGVPTPTVLASYGLFVTRDGTLESPANDSAPTRLVNAVIEPGGYLGKWCRANGATASLRALYRSGYTIEAAFGYVAQMQAEYAELAPNTLGGTATQVGLSMAPPLWLVNFALIYVLNPALAAKMPAYWTPIPSDLATALQTSSNGQVSYSDFAKELQ
jgi:hypothetical protein